MKGLQVFNAPSLAKLTSIRLGGSAIAEVLVDNLDGFDSLPGVLQRLGGRPVVFGRGSNILARGGELPLVLIRAGKDFDLRASEVLEDYEDSALIAASGGMPLPLLVSRASKAGFAGLNGLVGVPGSVGGAVAMNAGSFGMDIKGCIKSATIYSPRLGLVKKDASELDISYRHFSVPELAADEWFIVVQAEFLCRKANAQVLLDEMDGFHKTKSSTQPVRSHSAGCVFKNHDSGPAGKLLQDAGMKGKKLGGMMFSDLHANFLINTGEGTPEQAFELIDEACGAVLNNCGAALELEVRVWP